MSMLLLMDDTFAPYDLFRANEQGIWLDPSDFSTMFQDSAGTTPVTAVGQPVGLIRDKSGRGNHATQATAGNRPVLQQDSNGMYYLEFDGATSNRWLQTPSINFTATDKMTVWAGVRKLSDATAAVIIETSTNSASNNGTFALFGPRTAGASNYAFRSRGTVAAEDTGTGAANTTHILTCLGDISGDSVRIDINGVDGTPTTTDQGTGNYGNYPVYIGRQGGTVLPFNGRIYQLIVRGAASNAGQIAATEAYVNTKTGAYA